MLATASLRMPIRLCGRGPLAEMSSAAIVFRPRARTKHRHKCELPSQCSSVPPLGCSLFENNVDKAQSLHRRTLTLPGGVLLLLGEVTRGRVEPAPSSLDTVLRREPVVSALQLSANINVRERLGPLV